MHFLGIAPPPPPLPELFTCMLRSSKYMLNNMGEIIPLCLFLYDPGVGAFKAPPLKSPPPPLKSHPFKSVPLKRPPPPTVFCPHAFNFRATLLCVGDYSHKILGVKI